MWQNIMTRFGVPNTLISDNGFQFESKAFQRYCCDLGIKNKYSTPSHLQSNGQAKVTNKVIMDSLKKRPEEAKGRLVDELPHVLWTYRTTPRRSTRETPISMMYGSEVVILTEIGFSTLTNSFIATMNSSFPLTLT